ncbi:MAG: hypothetical protein E7665_09740 [Ruminococcaceae bacterium]|nr:hypothetical protein [Oscillospiraceae bacterium]
MNGFFLDLLNTSITSLWAVMVIVIIRAVFRGMPKNIRCVLWGIAAVRLIMPFSIESIFSLIPEKEVIDVTTYASGPNIQTGIEYVDINVNNYIADRYFEGVTVPRNNFANILTICGVVWLVGVAVMVLYGIISYVRLKVKVSASVKYEKNIFYCDDIDSPFIIGLFMPRIYLPSDIGEKEMGYVLKHELCHLKRKDHLWRIMGFAILSVHWFNPFLWLAYWLFCKDTELACDEAVIRDMDDLDKKGYSETLVSYSIPMKLIKACPVAFGEIGIKERIKAMIKYKKPTIFILAAAVIICAVAAVCLITDPLSTNSEAPGLTMGETAGTAGADENVSSSGKAEENEIVYRPFEEITKDYTIEQAIEDGFIIIDKNDVTHGEDTWKRFYENTQNGIPSKVGYILYDDIDPLMCFYEIIYDGEAYKTRTMRAPGRKPSEFKTYKYLIYHKGKAPQNYTECEYFEWYILSNEEPSKVVDPEQLTKNSDIGLLSYRDIEY